MSKITLRPPRSYKVKPIYMSNGKPLRLRGADPSPRLNRCVECGAPLSEPIPTAAGPVCSLTCARFASQ